MSITALTLFVEGLWGLCSKIQFHSSLLSDLIRKEVRGRNADIRITYTFQRTELYPFFAAYFNLLAKHHLAILDFGDINHSMYSKLEYPAFIAPLTVNGRRFVEHLRKKEVPNVHDNQYLTLMTLPHVQIEVFSAFAIEDDLPTFGPYTDVVAISFNSLLDYYHIEHWRRDRPDERPKRICYQNIFYHELKEYIAHRFDATPKDNLAFAYQDVPISPLICWLENWNQNQQVMPAYELADKTNAERAGLHDELVAIMSPSGVMTVSEPPLPQFPKLQLLNGERLRID